jgi:hypothetical protein
VIFDRCSLCGKTFDPSDAKVWTGETGKAHFYPCYLKFKGRVEVLKEWEKLLKTSGSGEK